MNKSLWIIILSGVVAVLLAACQNATVVKKTTKPTMTMAPVQSVRVSSKKNPGIRIVGTQKLSAVLAVGGARERVNGRVSLHIVALKNGRVMVEGLNVVFFGVPQQALAGKRKVQDQLGVLGLKLKTGERQLLKYDEKSNVLVGEVRMEADAAFLNQFAQPYQDSKEDLYTTPIYQARAKIRLAFQKPLDVNSMQVQAIPAAFSILIDAAPIRYKDYTFTGFAIEHASITQLNLTKGPLLLIEAARRLCIQPVRLWRLTVRRTAYPYFLFTSQYSGAGLAFGEPQLRHEWAKADIVFNIRAWKTLYAGNYWELDSSEAADLRGKINDDDCIEVFFPYDFDPDDMWGGGATFGLGTASSKVISSDGNARGGVDFTHLAHEFGHVLSLPHPNGSPGVSTGTLMCPSGYLNDNPHVNSQENKDNVSNPLLVFTIKLRTPGPDCQDSADCGACP